MTTEDNSINDHSGDTEALDTVEEYEVISVVEEEIIDPHKTGPKPKKLVAVEVYGYQIGRGRTRRVVSPDDVYKLAAIGCNDKEIAIWFDVDEQTLRNNFSAIMQKGREDLKQSLRRAMLKNALNGNAALQIFLAKNLLGMSDNPNQVDDDRVLPWNTDETQ